MQQDWESVEEGGWEDGDSLVRGSEGGRKEARKEGKGRGWGGGWGSLSAN